MWVCILKEYVGIFRHEQNVIEKCSGASCDDAKQVWLYFNPTPLAYYASVQTTATAYPSDFGDRYRLLNPRTGSAPTIPGIKEIFYRLAPRVGDLQPRQGDWALFGCI